MDYFERIAFELCMENKQISLNDFIEIPKRRQFQKMIQFLEKQGVISIIYPKVTEILFIGLGSDRKAKTKVLALIVKYCRKRYLKMCHGQPSPERREFYQCLHRTFGIPLSEQHNFNRVLCCIIKHATKNGIR